MQNPEIYLENEDNIFHQLRGHYLTINMMRHPDFIIKSEVKKEKKSSDKKSMQVSILEGRMQKLKYEKLRKKGGQTEEEKPINLQNRSTTGGYYSMNFLWEKLGENDIPTEDVKLKSWKQLNEDEQKQKITDFIGNFKSDMENQIWKEMFKDVLKKYLSNDLTVNFHKNSQKIMEIEKLVINPSCYYWNTD